MKSYEVARLLAYVTGLVNQELLLQVEYSGGREQILRAHAPARLRLSNAERTTLAEIGKLLGRKVLAKIAQVAKPDTILMAAVYGFKQRLSYLLLHKHRTARQCRKLAPRLLRSIYQLRHCGVAPLETRGDTLASWSEEIARMWRFTRSNASTEGFHNKMEVLQRQAYGFRNFNNYRNSR
jgi:hypothetical protein